MIYLADADDVFRVFMTLVFMFVAFMGWVGQFMKNRQQGAKRRPAQRPKQQNERVQNEIERFLQEVTGQKPAGQQPQGRPRPQAQSKPAVPPRRPPARRDERRPERREPSRSSQTAPEKPRRVARRATENAQPTATPASAAIETPAVVPPRVTGSAGRRTGDMITTLGTTIAKDLRDPEQVRKAIVMNMILGPPKSAQTKGDGGIAK